jgi:hypothetical protein
LDFPLWKQDSQIWKRLMDLLIPEEIDTTFEGVVFAKDFFVEEWFEMRASWWPRLHFGAAAATADLSMAKGSTKLIQQKHKFIKFMKTICRYTTFLKYANVSDNCFQAYTAQTG